MSYRKYLLLCTPLSNDIINIIKNYRYTLKNLNKIKNKSSIKLSKYSKNKYTKSMKVNTHKIIKSCLYNGFVGFYFSDDKLGQYLVSHLKKSKTLKIKKNGKFYEVSIKGKTRPLVALLDLNFI